MLYVLVAKSHIFGCYHNEPCKIGEKGFEDTESGFFMSLRPKLDLQYYKPSHESVVVYGSTARSVGIGKPACFEIAFGKEIKVKCELVPMFSEWIYQFVVKV